MFITFHSHRVCHFSFGDHCYYFLSALVHETIQPSASVDKCSQDFAATCSLQCANNKYAIDEDGCPICACASQSSRRTCPLMKCRDNCGELGYKTDSKGCRTCECASKSPKVECSRVMCRMFCVHGFRRDENGCEICACNSSPQPCPSLTCDNICLNGYQKDYSGKNNIIIYFKYSSRKKNLFFSSRLSNVCM